MIDLRNCIRPLINTSLNETKQAEPKRTIQIQCYANKWPVILATVLLVHITTMFAYYCYNFCLCYFTGVSVAPRDRNPKQRRQV